MKGRIRGPVWAAVTAVSLTAFISIQAAQEDTSGSTKSKAGRAENLQSGKTLGHVERANKIIGKEVIGSDNQKLGKIDDLILELGSGRILYAIIGSGGVAGVGEKKFAVAPETFTATANVGERRESRGVFERGADLHANFDKAKLNGAPQFTKEMDKDAEWGKTDFVNQVYQYFGQNAWWKTSTTSTEGQFNNVQKASDLIGMKIRNVSDQPMGKVDNVAVDLPAGRVVYVILSPDSSLNLEGGLYALPPDALTFGTDRKTLSSDISKEKLAGAPHFAKDNWATLSDPSFASQVYQYYGKQAYFETGGTLKPTGRPEEAPKKQD